MIPQIEYLFRFRDLSADTLPEHRQVISKRAACWWGWWKRPSEDGRHAVWESMRSKIDDEGQLLVGLYDSGSGVVHSAVVVDLVMPEFDEHGQSHPVRPADDEAELIPAYYRQSRHSRAWMRLSSISEDPIYLYGNYSYRNPPPLPQHSTPQLERLRDKRVMSHIELRSMDTTIWEIRPSHDEDSSGEFIAASPFGSTPNLSRPVECRGDWLLHITDLHYAVGDDRGQHRWRLEDETSTSPTLSDAVASALQDSRQVGAVVITGDLTFKATEPEFVAAEKGIRKLLDGYLSLSRDHLLVVPGNHDIRWGVDEAQTYVDDAKVTVASDEATAEYRAFYRRLFAEAPTDHLGMSRRFCMPGGVLIDVIGVNSSSLETGKNFLAGMGRVQEYGFDDGANALGWKRPGSALRILALHHHLALTENLESMNEYRAGFGIAIDAPRTLRKAAKVGVQLGIHGHKHRSFVWRSTVYDLPEFASTLDPSTVNILGGGSAGSTTVQGNRNFFNLIRLKEGMLQLEIYQAENGGTFDLIARREAPFALQDGRPSLGEWRKRDDDFPN